MLNKNTLFGKRDESPTPQKDPRPAGYGVQASSPVRPPAEPAATPAVESRPEPRTESRRSAPAPDMAAASGGSRLIVGPDVKLKGAEIQDCDTLVVEGRVEATMDSRVIQIAEKGSFSGKVGIDVAEIRGRFEGELTARQQLVIHSTGRVSGTIRYGKIVIEEGGEVSGDVKALAAGASSLAVPVITEPEGAGTPNAVKAVGAK